MRSVIPAHIVHRVMWLMLGFAGVIVAAIVLTSVVDAHDDDSGAGDATGTEMDTVEVLRQVWEETYSPCGEILTISNTGKESGDLREMGMFATVSGLPAIHSSRFQRCISNGLTGEAALSFVINDNLTLVISNSDSERASLIGQLVSFGDLDRTSQATELQNSASPSSKMRSSVYRNDPNGSSVVTGSSSFSISDLLRSEER